MGWLSGLVSSGVGNAIGASASAVSLAGGVGSRLLSLLSSGFLQVLASIGGALKGVLRFALSLPRAVLDGIGRLSDAVLGALGKVAQTLSGLLGGAARVAVSLFAGAVVGLVATVSKAVTSFTTLGRSITSLSASSGLNTGAAGATVNRFNALGVDANQLFGGQNATMFGMRAGLFGLPGYDDPRFAGATTARFQSMQGSVVGQLLSQQMLRSLNLDNAAGYKMVSTPVSQIAEQQNYASRVQGSLGLDPTRIASVTRQWDTLTNKAQTLTNSVLLKLADVALPYLNRALDKLTEIGAQYAGGVGSLIEQGTALFVRGVQTGYDALLQLGNFLWKTLPSAALGFTASMLTGIIQVVSAVPSLWDSFLTGISIAESALEPLFSYFAHGVESVQGALPGLFDTFMSGVNAVQAGLMTAQQLASLAFNKITEGLQAVYDSPLVQKIIAAIPAATQVLGGIKDVVGTGSNIGSSVAGAASGGDPSWEALGGLAGGWLAMKGLKALPGLALRLAGKSLLGGAAQAGAGGGMGLWSMAMANPVTGSLIHGVTAGAAVYSGLQRTGILGKAAPGLLEAAGNAYTRFGNIFHGRDWNEGVTQMQGTPAQHAGAMAAAQAQNPVNQVANMARAGLGDVSQMYQNNLAAVRGNGGSWSQSLQNAPGQIGGMLQGLAGGVGDWWNDAVREGTEHRGRLAQSLDDRFGGQLRDGVSTTTSRLEEALVMIAAKQAEVEGRGDLRDAIMQLLEPLKKIEGNTKNDKNTLTELLRALQTNNYHMAAQVIGEAMQRQADEVFLNRISPG